MSDQRHEVYVRPEEAGMKLLRFLERRLLLPQAASNLHKWIRTGQIRVNGGRSKPFALLAAGDKVRIPPFADLRSVDASPREGGSVPAAPDFGPGLRLLARTPDVLVLVKDGGLACQPGSEQRDSVSARLAAAYGDQAFIPAPAHRLDRRTSGLLLAAANHAAQRRLHELFHFGGISKDYLAWVAGDWPWAEPCLLHDNLARRTDGQGRERVTALPGGETICLRDMPTTGIGAILEARGLSTASALCLAAPVQRSAQGSASATLMLVRLITGRKHQIRAQLAARGFPLVGDGLHGGEPGETLFLHAYALRLPGDLTTPEPRPELVEYTALPEWPPDRMPDPQALRAARTVLEERWR